jgi:hypothetical protein
MTLVLSIDDDEYNFGVNEMNMEIKFVETGSGNIFIKDNEMENPFFVGIHGGALTKLEDKEIYSKYKRVFVVCMKDSFDTTDYKIFDRIIKKDILYSFGKNFIILKSTMSLLRNNYYKNLGCIVEKTTLHKLFGKIYEFENSEIIIPMFELTESTAKINLSLYDKQFGIENVKDILDLTSYYNKKYKRPVMDQLTNHLSNLRESEFWCQLRNCDINMTNAFMERTFKYKNSHDENVKMSVISTSEEKMNNDVEKVIATLMEGGKKDMDYLNFIHRNDVYTDIYTALQKADKRTYYINLDNTDLKIDIASLTEIVCSIDDETELYYTFNSLLVSKEYCHMVLNNSKILDKVKPLLQKYAPVYKYIFGYAWLCFIIEESIMKTKSHKDNRYVFDIGTANKLPSFPFVFDDLTQNPYLAVLVNKTLLNASKNVVGLYCIEDYEGYGVCTLEQFKWRFNLFTSGNATKNILDGIDWKYFAVSGSVIPACLQKKSPLFDTVIQQNQLEEDKWLTFFNHYYSESDIDMMCNDQSIFGFTDKVNSVIEQIKKNIQDYTEGDIVIEPIKSMVVIVTKHFFEEKLSHYNETFGYNLTNDEMINQLGSNEMKEYLYLRYVENKTKSNTTIRRAYGNTNQYIKAFMKLSEQSDMNIQYISYEAIKMTNKSLDSDMCFYINDFRNKDNKVPEEKNFMIMKIGENIKFKIKSKKMARCIELFRSKSQDFFGVVARFHLPCVRAYYQGDNVYILPSCITAMQTGINIDYKYFAGVRDPIDIINKYEMRGFCTLITDQEKKHKVYYNTNVKTFGGMFHIASNTKEEINKAFGPRELSDKIYQPLVYINGLSKDIYTSPNVKYVKTMEDLKRIYADKYQYQCDNFGFDLFKFKTVTDLGSVMPYASWVQKAYIDMKSMTEQTKKSNVLHNDVKKPLVKKPVKPKVKHNPVAQWNVPVQQPQPPVAQWNVPVQQPQPPVAQWNVPVAQW